MKIKYLCKNCKKYPIIKTNAISRYELSDKKSETFMAQCSFCISDQKLHVNQTIAESNNMGLMMYILGTIALIALMTSIFWNKGYISTISFGLPLFVLSILMGQSKTKVNTYNKHRV
ncbi:MAG: hypothetical protein V3V14_09080 [Saprospiraceae bacterium]